MPAKHSQYCSFIQGRYTCKAAPRHILQKLSIPPEACAIHDCTNCITSKSTFILGTDFSLIKPQTFLLRADKSPRNTTDRAVSTFYECDEIKDTTCDCRQHPCSGDKEFCDVFPCTSDNPHACQCRLTRDYATLLHVTPHETLINPPQITFTICLFTKPQPQVHRRLLENEEAAFTQNNLTIKFKDPVLTLPDVGRVVLRTPDFEHVISVPDDLIIILPYELLAYKNTLTIIYIHPKGFSVTGIMHVEGKRACQLSQCIFCREGLRTVSCWPSYAQYVFYVCVILLTLLLLWFLKFVIKTVVWFLRTIVLTLMMTVRVCKGVARLCLLIGAYFGDTTRHMIQSVIGFLENRAQQRANMQPFLLALITLFVVLGPVTSDCSDHAVIYSELESCETSSQKGQTCHVSTTAELTLKNIGHETCLWFHDSTERNLFSLKIRFVGVNCNFHTKRQYYTFPITAHHLSQISCYQNYWCGRGTHCVMPVVGHQGLGFEAETPESRDYPGLSTCVAGGIGVGCTILTRASCNFRRTWYVPDLLHSYEVSKITGHTCNYVVAIDHVENGTVTQVSIKNDIYTPTGIKISVLGAYDQPQSFFPDSLVQRVGNPMEAYLLHASPKNVPQAGTVGAVQANISFTKTFIFDPKLSTCDFYEDSLRCQTVPDPILTMTRSQESALPLTRDMHLMQITDDRLSSTLLSSSAVRIQLQFSKFKISVESRTVCPKFVSTDFQSTGCYNCQIFARITFKALSTCQSGLVSVLFQEILVYTKSIKLSTEAEEFVIKFLAEKKCYSEKLCLRASELLQCQTLQICLDEPSIELLSLNTNYTRTTALGTTASLFDWIHFPSLNSAFFLLKLAGAALVILCLSLTLFSTLLTCCRRR